MQINAAEGLIFMKKYESNYETSLLNGGKQQCISYVREEMGEKELHNIQILQKMSVTLQLVGPM